MTQYIVIGRSTYDGRTGESYYGPYDSLDEAQESIDAAIRLHCGCDEHILRYLITPNRPSIADHGIVFYDRLKEKIDPNND
jgi:hypothetical protein